MESKLNILQHSLGLNQNGDGRQYRNHFVATPGSGDFYDCCVLVEKGLMEHTQSELTGHCFVVTPAGIDFVKTARPTKSLEKLPTQAGRAALLAIAAGRCSSRGLSSPSQRINHFHTLIALRERGLITWDDQLTDAGKAMVERLTRLQEVRHAA